MTVTLRKTFRVESHLSDRCFSIRALDVGLMLPMSFPDKTTALLGAFASRFAIGFVIGCVQLPGWPGWLVGLLFGLLISEATRMAAFPSRDRDAFMAHWAKIMSNETGILNTILADDTVVGNVVYWEAAGEPNIGYWLGKTHWGKGIASAALAQFLTKIEARPVYAHVAKHNFASIRVLQKCGFQLAREDMCDGDDGEELVMELRSDFPKSSRCATAANKPTKT